jgi:uncharacterized protein
MTSNEISMSTESCNESRAILRCHPLAAGSVQKFGNSAPAAAPCVALQPRSQFLKGAGIGRRGWQEGRHALQLAVAIFMALLHIFSYAQQLPRFNSLKEIRERGVVMQHWETSCAAATLATVLTYGFRDPVTEQYAAVKMLEKTDPAKVKKQGGFSLLDMKRFVESRGYHGDAYKNLSFDDLKVFHAPIVPIENYGYHHYVVFNGVQGQDVLLADPGFGNRTMRLSEFEKIWMDGMAFVVTRGGPQ